MILIKLIVFLLQSYYSITLTYCAVQLGDKNNNSCIDYDNNSIDNLALESEWYIPKIVVPIAFETTTRATGRISHYAIQWPQDNIYDVVARIVKNGTSPFSGESIILYPEKLLHDLKKKQDKENSKRTISNSNGGRLLLADRPRNCDSKTVTTRTSSSSTDIWSTHAFHQLYNLNSFLYYDTQMLISSAITFFHIPRVLIFGSGLDSSLFCKAVVDMHPKSQIFFIENDEEWFNWTNDTLFRISSRCKVLKVVYDTKLEDWMDLLGLEEEMSQQITSQLPPDVNLGKNKYFDVILVDGPIGSHFGEHGRMSSLATAKKLIRRDGNGIIFVDDIDRFVEMIYSRYLFRPIFGSEHVFCGWGNTRDTVFFTKNSNFLNIYDKLLLLKLKASNHNKEEMAGEGSKSQKQQNGSFIDFWKNSHQMASEHK